MPLSNPANPASTSRPESATATMIIPLPYGLWDGDRHITSLGLDPITGADERAVAEALADGATPAAAGNLLLASCTQTAPVTPAKAGAHRPRFG